MFCFYIKRIAFIILYKHILNISIVYELIPKVQLFGIVSTLQVPFFKQKIEHLNDTILYFLRNFIYNNRNSSNLYIIVANRSNLLCYLLTRMRKVVPQLRVCISVENVIDCINHIEINVLYI